MPVVMLFVNWVYLKTACDLGAVYVSVLDQHVTLQVYAATSMGVSWR